MPPARNNHFEIGKIPRVVGTLTTRAGLAAFSHEYRDACDIAEVRLDEIGVFSGWTEACQKIEAAGRPAMLTLRSTKDGGKCDRSREDRLAILTQAVDYASIIDVEYNSDSPEKIRPAVHAAGKTLLVSYHDFAQTPSRQVLEKIIAEAGRHASAIKIATMVNDVTKNAPAGSEQVVAMVKNAIVSANAGFDQMTKSAKQAADTLEANVATTVSKFSQAAEKVTTRATKK